MQMRDELGTIYDDELFASVYAEVGQPAIAPWRLALVSVMQFAENLSDRQGGFRCSGTDRLEICSFAPPQ